MLKVDVKNPLARQFQMEYAVYMMLGSYFKKATCTSKRIEERLFLHYQDLSDEKQYRLEEEVIEFIEKGLLLALNIPGHESKEVQIGFLPKADCNIILLRGKDFKANLIVKRVNGKLKYIFLRNLEAQPEEKKVTRKKKVVRDTGYSVTKTSTKYKGRIVIYIPKHPAA